MSRPRCGQSHANAYKGAFPGQVKPFFLGGEPGGKQARRQMATTCWLAHTDGQGTLTAQFSTLVRPILTVRIPITLPSVRHTLTTVTHKVRFSTCLLDWKGKGEALFNNQISFFLLVAKDKLPRPRETGATTLVLGCLVFCSTSPTPPLFDTS